MLAAPRTGKRGAEEKRQDSGMSRVRRVDAGGEIYHALNRANFRSRLFRTAAHYQDFLGIVEEALAFVPTQAKEVIANIRYAIERSRP